MSLYHIFLILLGWLQGVPKGTTKKGVQNKKSKKSNVAANNVPESDIAASNTVPQPDVAASNTVPQPDVAASTDVPDPDVPEPDVAASAGVPDLDVPGPDVDANNIDASNVPQPASTQSSAEAMRMYCGIDP